MIQLLPRVCSGGKDPESLPSNFEETVNRKDSEMVAWDRQGMFLFSPSDIRHPQVVVYEVVL